MGNCQAIDAAALVIQHPNGRIDRLYWPVSASEVMKMNPGHYVSLIIPLPVSEEGNQEVEQKAAVRFTRVKLLRSNDTLTLGHAYRLVTTQGMVCVYLMNLNSWDCFGEVWNLVLENLYLFWLKVVDVSYWLQRLWMCCGQRSLLKWRSSSRKQLRSHRQSQINRVWVVRKKGSLTRRRHTRYQS